jgi:predicted nuclease of predicted toxin-antitoxin system
MKFLADMGVSMSTVRSLRERGHNVLHLREQGLQCLPDDRILDKAAREQCAVLTFDLGFGELLARGLKAFPSVIIFRLSSETPSVVTARLLAVLGEAEDSLSKGAVVTIEDTRYRVRHLPIERLRQQ